MRQHLRKFFFILGIIISVTGCKKDDSTDITADPKAENLKALGASAEDLLSDDIYESLTVELVYTASFKPTEESLVAFRNFIDARVHKIGGIQFVETEIPDQAGAPFTLDEIKGFEEEFRTQYTVGNDIAVFVFFSNGSSSNDTQNTVTLGTAYRNTSIVIYEKTLRTATQSDPSLLPILEQTTLEHEFGHILGLVNIQNDDIHTVHEDPLSSKHCIVEECLMYFDATNVLRSQLGRMLLRGSVPQLDPLCIEDLQAKGGK
ncbi:MAG: membrane metalloprotease [Flavobacteriaceae bacterium]